MELFLNLISSIPNVVYKFIVIFLSAFIFLTWKLGFLKWIKVKVVLPEDFMRNFRWITPLTNILMMILVLFQCYVMMRLYFSIMLLLSRSR